MVIKILIFYDLLVWIILTFLIPNDYAKIILFFNFVYFLIFIFKSEDLELVSIFRLVLDLVLVNLIGFINIKFLFTIPLIIMLASTANVILYKNKIINILISIIILINLILYIILKIELIHYISLSGAIVMQILQSNYLFRNIILEKKMEQEIFLALQFIPKTDNRINDLRQCLSRIGIEMNEYIPLVKKFNVEKISYLLSYLKVTYLEIDDSYFFIERIDND